jgi:transcriptional regulator with XRE-family HTH domain
MAKLTPGQLVRQSRTRSGITRERLAFECGTSVSTIARLELNDRIPSLRILTAICEHIDISLADIALAQKHIRSTSAA